ncbi:uncharacterized protein LOC128249431 [Octopus bimaculoides]|uniref:uncharacterized protein LOC128249431 n=1 Tax=Octopus bimaculoides TaxID=37653 RepID=UPI0022E4841A|nr:uncharacterized protein LOC128249431 [Octopus bimaculoides]
MRDYKQNIRICIFIPNLCVSPQYRDWDSSLNLVMAEILMVIKFFLLQNQTGNKVAIVGNGRCDTQPTFSVSVEGALQNLPKVVIQIKTNDTSSVQISQSVSFSKWISLVIVKTESDIRVKLDKNPEVIHPAGKVERHDCAFGVGNMTNMTNLVGYVKDFYFAKCLDN